MFVLINTKLGKYEVEDITNQFEKTKYCSSSFCVLRSLQIQTAKVFRCMDIEFETFQDFISFLDHIGKRQRGAGGGGIGTRVFHQSILVDDIRIQDCCMNSTPDCGLWKHKGLR